jgi:hypothetical protein
VSESRATRRVNRGSRFQLGILRIADDSDGIKPGYIRHEGVISKSGVATLLQSTNRDGGYQRA